MKQELKRISRIKIIKRKSAAVAPETAKPNQAFSERRAEREIAGRISDWVRERREQKRAEDARNLRRLFGDTRVVLSGAF